MRAPEYHLLLDQGGHSSRAMVIDHQGVVRAQARIPVETLERGERVEQDGPAILDSLRQAIAAVAQTLGDDCHHLQSAGLAVQRGSVLCWRRSNGEALSPVLSWRDRRAPAKAQLEPRLIRQRSGLRFSPYGGALKLRWCLDELSGVQQAHSENDLLMGPLGSYLLQGLLREAPARVDPTLAQRTLLYDRWQGDWSEETLAELDLDRAQLPRIVPSRSSFGHLQGSQVNCPLILLQGDQNAVPWVAGRPQTDTVYINLGTGAFMLRPVSSQAHDSETHGGETQGGEQDPGPFQFTLLDPEQSPHYALEASVHGAGAALQWFAKARGRAVEAEEIQASLINQDRPPLFINTVGGLGSPWWQPGPDPYFLDREGKTLALKGEDPAQLSGLLESLCFLIQVNLDAMERLAGPVERVIVAGGLSRSPALCQRLAQLMDRPLYRLDNSEATSVGLWQQLAQPEQFHWGEPVATDGPNGSVPGLQSRFRLWREHLASALESHQSQDSR